MAVTPDLDTLTGDPHEALAAVRAEHPVTWLPPLGGWLITGHAAAVEVMRDPDRFTVDHPGFTTARVVGRSMLSTDGADHRRHRTPFVGLFRRSAVAGNMTPEIEGVAASAVARIADRGEAELRRDLAAPVAADVMAGIMGLRAVGTDRLLWIYRHIVGAVEALSRREAPNPLAAEAVAELRTLIATREDAPALEVALPVDDLAANAAVLLFGGIETGEGMNASTLWFLLTVEDLLARVRRRPEVIGAVVEESIRLEPPAARVDRYATVDTEVGGTRVTAGDLVVVSITAANRDPAVFDDPNTFRLDRRNRSRHLAFATGPHACIGVHVARAETTALIRAVIDRLPDIRLDQARSRPHRGLVFRKPESVWAKWASAG